MSMWTTAVLELNTKKVVEKPVRAEWVVCHFRLRHRHNCVDQVVEIHATGYRIFINKMAPLRSIQVD
ncbi:hypothetical protein TNCV_2941951 [Trichonephila clavipes]|nr:hypothetical protein TNCV_2941951 [Trichonephila clavipes]